MKMSNSNIPGPMITLMQGNPNLKEYRCPRCKRFLFKGNVQKLNMLCHHCQKLIVADGNDSVTLVGFGTFKTAIRKTRKERNPQTGKEINIAEKNVPKFAPGKALKDAVK